MGCDIHAHAEYRINGRWEHVKEVFIHRNYELFGMLVEDHPRNRNNSKSIAPERGLPKDVNPFTKKVLDRPEDFHTHSFVTGSELKILEDTNDQYTFLIDTEYGYEFSQDEIFSEDFRIVFAFDS